MARLTAWTTDWESWRAEQAQALDRARAALDAELTSRGQEFAQRTKDRDKMRRRYIDKPSDATEEALVECRRLVEEAEQRCGRVRTRLDAYQTGSPGPATVASRFAARSGRVLPDGSLRDDRVTCGCCRRPARLRSAPATRHRRIMQTGTANGRASYGR